MTKRIKEYVIHKAVTHTFMDSRGQYNKQKRNERLIPVSFLCSQSSEGKPLSFVTAALVVIHSFFRGVCMYHGLFSWVLRVRHARRWLPAGSRQGCCRHRQGSLAKKEQETEAPVVQHMTLEACLDVDVLVFTGVAIVRTQK